jgi:hypothetical protein
LHLGWADQFGSVELFIVAMFRQQNLRRLTMYAREDSSTTYDDVASLFSDRGGERVSRAYPWGRLSFVAAHPKGDVPASIVVDYGV